MTGRARRHALADLKALAPLGRQLRTQAAAQRREALERDRDERCERSENEVFRKAVADAVPLPDDGRVDLPRRAPAPAARQRERDDRAVLAASLSDEIDIERLLDTDESLSWHRASVGPDVVRRLRRGEWTVRGQIDLHGLRVDEARAALAEFLGESQRHEWRCVRVIHGKGLGSVGREPVLKAKVPRWLVQRRDVLAFCQARPNDGGSGALIVLLQPPARPAP